MVRICKKLAEEANAIRNKNSLELLLEKIMLQFVAITVGMIGT